MGVVNVTPDSFSDGGRYLDPDAAIAHGLALVDDGRRGARRRRRVHPARRRARSPPTRKRRGSLPVIRALAADGRRPDQRRHHQGLGRGRRARSRRDDRQRRLRRSHRSRPAAGRRRRRRRLRRDAHAGRARARCSATRTTTTSSREVGDFLVERLDAAAAAGIARESLMADPGIGFGKTATHNLTLLAELADAGRAGRRAGARRDVAQDVHRSPARCRRSRGPRRRHARHGGVGARSRRPDGAGPRRRAARHAPRRCSTSSKEPRHEEETA